MKRLVLAFTVVFAFGAMCSGGGDVTDAADGDDDDDKDKKVVVVPVPDDGSDEEHYCCSYVEEEDGPTKFALVEGPADCKDKYGDQDGEWVSGPECTPCCCKSPNDEDDEEAGFSYELTTPTTCSEVGDCMAADAKECKGMDKGKGGDGKAGDDDDPKRPARKPARPGSGGSVKRPGTR